MGAVTIFFIPFVAVFVLIANLFVSVTGLNVAEIVLPYDPDTGLVWEYREESDDIYTELKETVIDGKKQIFRFVKSDAELVYRNGYITDLVFEAENGGERTFYADTQLSFNRIKFLSEEDVITYDFTVTATKDIENITWELNYSDRKSPQYMLYEPDMTGKTKTFRIVYEPGSEDKDYLYTYVIFKDGEYYEWHCIELEFKRGEAKVISTQILTSDRIRNN